MNSLRLRLILLLFIGLGITWLASAWFNYKEARHEIDALFDAQLAQSAQVLLETTRHELHERIERGDDETPISHEYEQKLAFQIWDKNKLLLRSPTAPMDAMAEAKAGYSEIKINEQTWRVLARWDTQQEFMIQVAEPMTGRESLARHITLKMLFPTFIALPVLGLLVWLGVGAGLQPLQQLKQEVRQRAANRLEPLAMTNVPEEVVPLTQALNELFNRLQQAFESERRFTADAAHELRTPLAALKIQAQVALRSSDNVERQHALENVLRGTDRAARLVEQLLTLAKVDPKTAAVNFKSVQLRDLVSAVMADLEPLADAKQIEMTLEKISDNQSLVTVLGNEAQLGLMIRNLIDNAIRYTPKGGRVELRVNNQNGVSLEVCDTGPGIVESEREKVLQRFYRVIGSGEEGSGLGLSIVRRITELHGAQLDLTDNPLKTGLLVRVYWPTIK